MQYVVSYIDSSGYASGPIRICLFIDYIIMYISDCCDKLFELYLSYMENSTKKKASVWPFQMMLLVLCPVSIHSANQSPFLSNYLTRPPDKRV